MDDTHTDVVGKRLHQRAAKPVGRCQTVVRTTERRNGFAPLAHLAAPLWVVDGRHQQETRAGTRQVLCFRTRGSLHVRLSEAEEDVEILVGFRSLLRLSRIGMNAQHGHQRQCKQEHCLHCFSHDCYVLWLSFRVGKVTQSLWQRPYEMLQCVFDVLQPEERHQEKAWHTSYHA